MRLATGRGALLWTALLALVTALAAGVAPAGEAPAGKSGYDFMGRDTRAMQDDDAANPGTLWVLDGERLWRRREGEAGRACADCHGDAFASMKGVAARYPAFDASLGRPVNLEQRINQCRTGRQGLAPLPYESRNLLALTAYLARQSRGLPVAPDVDPRLGTFLESGRATFFLRQGQLNLSCAQCHDDHWGKKLAGNVIPQAHPTGYPLYRLEWQSLGSLQRRLRNCLTGMRAETPSYGADELVNLELFLMARARGMRVESPAVRP